MKDNLYKKTLDRLRQIKPEPVSAIKLTDCIMNGIDNVPLKKQRVLTLMANETQWTIYRGLRALLTTAAVFLIVFFVFQQYQINQKLSRLEKELSSSSQYTKGSHYLYRNQQIQKARYELKDTQLEFAIDSQQPEILQINRRSLDYLLEAIRELENENVNYREKLHHYYSDSTFSKY
jgi:hypothetical protein